VNGDGYLLDTNIVGHYFNEHPHVLARINILPEDAGLFVSVITLGEIWFGHAVTTSTNLQRRDECDRWINNTFPYAIQITRHTRVNYGDIKAALFRTFPPISKNENHPERCFDRVTGAELGIDENDLWIAAQALEHNLVLVTNDEMVRIREVATTLDVMDWTQPV
jgi:tRNA(fMet)-specific endonuclease VapC